MFRNNLSTKVGFFLLLTIFNVKLFSQPTSVAQNKVFEKKAEFRVNDYGVEQPYVQFILDGEISEENLHVGEVFARVNGVEVPVEPQGVKFSRCVQRIDNNLYTNVIFDDSVRVDGANLGAISRVKIRIDELEEKNDVGFDYSANLISNSVLSKGSWYKVKVAKEGFVKLSYAYLEELGLPVAGLKSEDLLVAGNSMGIMPVKNDVYRPNDLALNSTIIQDGGDGVLNPGDYVLFYSAGPHDFDYSDAYNMYLQTKNMYDDFTYYFVGVSPGVKSPAVQSEQSVPKNGVQDLDYNWEIQFHEIDEVNVIKSGKVFYGEKFENKNKYTFPFNFSHVRSGKPLKVAVDVVNRSITSPSYFTVDLNGQSQANITSSAISPSAHAFGFPARKVYELNGGFANALNVDIEFVPLGTQSIGYLNFITLNIPKELDLAHGNQTLRCTPGNAWNVVVNNAAAGKVYDVTNPTNLVELLGIVANNQLTFSTDSNGTHIYALLGDQNVSAPIKVGSVANQNLHGITGAEYVIITHPNFRAEAERLAILHRESGLKVEIVEPNYIYNEFSSGAVDPTGIKDFLKHLYFKNKQEGTADLKYMLLFGDGSYNNKSTEGNTNFLPTYQSDNSTSETASYVTDDYFGFLDNNESERSSDLVDIGIGRFPVQTVEQARAIVNKIYNYSGYNISEQNEDEVYGDWRNKILFVTDDQDGSTTDGIVHMRDANRLAEQVEGYKKGYKADKVYSDSYRQETTPGGERYPDVNAAIKQKVQNGALVVNYTGHGGEVGWAHERILDVSTIQGWTNYNKLPLFVTATCEFSRFDDFERTSAGEMVLLNAKGGGIALLTTTRLVYSSPNYLINNNFYKSLFPADGEDKRLGDVTRETKNKCSIQNSQSINHLNFALLGDPGLRLAYPKYRVQTTHINGVPIEAGMDTLKALGIVRLQGNIVDNAGTVKSDFDGVLDVTVYDKPEEISTLANDGGAPYNYSDRLNIIFKGRASVKNGQFDFQFVVPKDISPSVGFGYINYYAHAGGVDANGENDTLSVGGVSENGIVDDEGPEVDLTLNKEGFVSGDFVGENPEMMAFVFDESGINTTGNGIGHDLVAILDEKTSSPVVLNQYFKYDIDSYQRGVIQYPFSSLDEGEHTLSIKVWDINNNSASTSIDFIVIKSGEIKIENLLNYPNPANQETTFSFEHNFTGMDVNTQLIVMDMTGRKVKEINQFINEDNYKSKSLTWNLQTDGGDIIKNGIYVYKLVVTLPNGNQLDKAGRMVIAR